MAAIENVIHSKIETEPLERWEGEKKNHQGIFEKEAGIARLRLSNWVGLEG